MRRHVRSPGPGPLGRAPDSAVPGAILREQPASPCRAIVPRLSAERFQLWRVPVAALGTGTTCLCHTELRDVLFSSVWGCLNPCFLHLVPLQLLSLRLYKAFPAAPCLCTGIPGRDHAPEEGEALWRRWERAGFLQEQFKYNLLEA